MKKIATLVLVTLIAVLAIMPVAFAVTDDDKLPIDVEELRSTGFQGFYPPAEVEAAPVDDAPQTADAAPVALLVSLMAVSAAAFVACKH